MSALGDLHPDSLRRLLLQIEKEQAQCSEKAFLAYRLAKMFERSYFDLEHRRQEVGSLLARLYEVEQLYEGESIDD